MTPPPNPEPVIRRATVADAAGIGAVHAAGFRWAYRGRFPDDYLDTIDVDRRIAWWVRNLAADPPIVVFVAQADHADDAVGGVIGFCHVGPAHLDAEPHTGELNSVYLLESAAGRGIGADLARVGLQTLREHGYRQAILWVLATNSEARGFYEHLGWRDDGTRHTYTLRNDVKAPAVRYRIDL